MKNTRPYKVAGFMTLHYGKEYLKESLMSIKDHVDVMVIAYTKNPSHGHRTSARNPDTEEEMRAIAFSVFENSGVELIWDSQERYTNESNHRARKYFYTISRADMVLTIDADEVFEPTEVGAALDYAWAHDERYYGIKGYVNFWRNFEHACYDGFRPIRIEKLNTSNNNQNLECPLTIYHFSTCQSEPVMRYKYKVFGHASEIKHGWLDKYYAWTPENNFGDLHPVSIGLWNAVKFDKTTLPYMLKQHPNYNKQLI